MIWYLLGVLTPITLAAAWFFVSDCVDSFWARRCRALEERASKAEADLHGMRAEARNRPRAIGDVKGPRP